MSSLRELKLAVIIASSLAVSCITESDLGSSVLLPVATPQSAVGLFRFTSRAAVGDLDGDGFDDLVVWTNEGQVWSGTEFLAQPPRVFVFYGREGGLAESVDPEEADATFVVRSGEVVQRVEAQDLDSDGAAELIVHATIGGGLPLRFAPANGEGAVYVVPGGRRYDSPESLEGVGAPTPSYPVVDDEFDEWPVTMTMAHVDLDGVAGAEYLTRFQDPDGDLPQAIHVRSLGTGELRAKLSLPDQGTIEARAVFDYDADGHDDVLVFYVLLENGPLYGDHRDWTEYGVGVFYGPILGDLTLRDPGTQALVISLLPPNEKTNLLIDAEGRVMVGRFDADEHLDLVLPLSPSALSLVFPGGQRGPRPNYMTAGSIRYPEDTRTSGVMDLTMTVPGRGTAGNDAMFWLSDRFGVATLNINTNVDGVEGSIHRSAERPDGEGAPVFDRSGGAVGDIDGNGQLDIVLGTNPADGEEFSRVHILYDFGG